MQSPPSVTLRLVAVVAGYGRYEQLVHEAFSAHRGRGEWFSPACSEAIRAAIAGGLQAFIDDLVMRATGKTPAPVPISTEPPARPALHGSRVYARGRRLWCRVKRDRWMSMPTPYNVGQEEMAIRYAREAQRKIDVASLATCTSTRKD
jgi:hypothetical protein